MHKIFVSYHHKNDQWYKEELLRISEANDIFIDGSVETGDISDDLSDESIRTKIRDEYLKDTSVTIVLFGIETKGRKHVDWEIYSSMIDGSVNKKSGIIVVNLPSTGSGLCSARHTDEQSTLYPEITNWINITSREEYKLRYPYLSDRIIDNLLVSDAKVSVIPWSKIEENPENLRFLIDATYADRSTCNYDLSRQMRRRDA